MLVYDSNAMVSFHSQRPLHTSTHTTSIIATHLVDHRGNYCIWTYLSYHGHIGPWAYQPTVSLGHGRNQPRSPSVAPSHPLTPVGINAPAWHYNEPSPGRLKVEYLCIFLLKKTKDF